MTIQPEATGICWCGCGEETKPNRFFLPGHDRRAEAAVVRVEYGSVARFLEDLGYGPGGKNALEARNALEQNRKDAQSR